MITQERLRELIDYNPVSGMALWKTPRAGITIGNRVGFISRGKRGKPYRSCKLKEGWKGPKPFSHVVFFYMTGQWPIEEMDHRNLDGLDDRWNNLRESTRAQNEANRGARKNSKTGIKGVRQRGKRFVAEIYRSGVHKHLGYFDTLEEALRAYLAEAEKHDGEFLRAA